jgi:hypothetical protein
MLLRGLSSLTVSSVEKIPMFFWARIVSFSWYAHFIANLLFGSVFLSAFGSSLRSLLPSVIAFFASSSAFSFPSIPSCPGVHLIKIFIPRCCFLTPSRLWCSMSKT